MNSSSLEEISSLSHTDQTTARSVSPSKQKRIVHILKHCWHGNGNVNVAVDLACLQAEAGHQVTLASGGGTFEGLLKQYGVEHIHIEQRSSKPFESTAGAYKFLRFIRKWKPDVVHAHMMSGAMLGYLGSRLAGISLVTTVHNSFDRHSVLMRLGRRVVAVSHAERKHLIEQGYDPDRVDVIMNAPAYSPRESFFPAEPGRFLRHPSILTVCGLHQRKGIADLLDACAEVFPKFPEWHLAIAGEGPDEAKLKAHALRLGIENRVDFLGFVRSPRPLLLQAEIFVLASYADPCSLVVGEARAAGCAIVATAVGGTPEMLDYGRIGRLVTPGRPRELAAQLEQLMADKPARERLKEVSLRGSEEFHVRRLIEDYDRVYQSAILQAGYSTAGLKGAGEHS